MQSPKQLFRELPFERAIQTLSDDVLRLFRTRTITLDSARTDFSLKLSGNLFYVLDATDVSIEFDVKFNSSTENAITFTKGLGIITPFKNIFITNTAQAGKTVTIITGVEAPELLQLIDNRSTLDIATATDAIQNQLQGDTTEEDYGQTTVGTSAVEVYASNTDRKGFFIQSHPDNTGRIFLGYDNTVSTTNNFVVLEPGDSFSRDDYRGDVYAISDTATQKVQSDEV